MAKIEFIGSLPTPKKENLLRQGDFVFCEAKPGALDFWGIVNQGVGIISINGGSDKNISGTDLYLGEEYSHWRVVKRVPCGKMKVTLEEIE
ncbi:hypothetical protein [Exiguobacterium sp. s133]|uniref:hypothetical protein n=1 Tax=Exiguobacterium sp. s133 TaxID=2751213 RepID=UPI001BEA9A5D|nr:hypothetical protein [Exiguobacterium sp. s133]